MAVDTTSMDALYQRPGFMIRRAYQITASLFEDEAPNGVTPTQYSILHSLRAHPDIDQISLCALIGIDRSTATLVLRHLERKGLIERRVPRLDKRRKVLSLTGKGVALLDEMAPVGNAIVAHMEQALDEGELAQLLHLLGKFVQAYNARTRTPLKTNVDPYPAGSEAHDPL